LAFAALALVGFGGIECPPQDKSTVISMENSRQALSFYICIETCILKTDQSANKAS